MQMLLVLLLKVEMLVVRTILLGVGRHVARSNGCLRAMCWRAVIHCHILLLLHDLLHLLLLCLLLSMLLLVYPHVWIICALTRILFIFVTGSMLLFLLSLWFLLEEDLVFLNCLQGIYLLLRIALIYLIIFIGFCWTKCNFWTFESCLPLHSEAFLISCRLILILKLFSCVTTFGLF